MSGEEEKSIEEVVKGKEQSQGVVKKIGSIEEIDYIRESERERVDCWKLNFE